MVKVKLSSSKSVDLPEDTPLPSYKSIGRISSSNLSPEKGLSVIIPTKTLVDGIPIIELSDSGMMGWSQYYDTVYLFWIEARNEWMGIYHSYVPEGINEHDEYSQPFQLEEQFARKILEVYGDTEEISLEQILHTSPLEIEKTVFPGYLPDYRIIRKLGEGAYKKVFLGRNIHSEEEKALKVITLSPRGEDHLLQRNMTLDNFIKAEAITSMKVKEIGNPHLVRVEEVRYEQPIGHYVLYEELLEETLKEMIQNRAYNQGAYRDKAYLLDHVMQLADGLRALHESGLVHGDLAVSNIGIKKGIIKITDFGLASSLASVAEETHERHNMGALFTRAPELFTGEKPTDKSDVWSFGVIAYVMASGEYPPFIPAGDRPKLPGKEREAYEREVKRMMDQADLDSMIKNSPINPRIKNLLYKCLLREPQCRWTMSEISGWLQNPEAVIGVSYSEKVDVWAQWFRDEKQEEGSMILNDPLNHPQKPLPFLQAGVHYSFIIDQEETVLACEWLHEDSVQSRKNYTFIVKNTGLIDTFGVDLIEKSPQVRSWLRTVSPIRNSSEGERPYLHLLLEKKLEGKKNKNIYLLAHPAVRPLLEMMEEERNYVLYPVEIKL